MSIIGIHGLYCYNNRVMNSIYFMYFSQNPILVYLICGTNKMYLLHWTHGTSYKDVVMDKGSNKKIKCQ